MSARSAAVSAAKWGIRSVARGADRVRPPDRGLVVLSYHQVGGPVVSSVNVDRSVFEDQMAVLAAQRHLREIVTLDEGVDLVDLEVDVAGERPRVDDAIAITFDDGTADFVDQALPVLVDHHLPVTLYLATAFVEDGRSFWDDGTVLSWSALADALSTGVVDIGTHTHTHVLLDRADPAVVRSELERSTELVRERLGVTPRHFAYPKAIAPAAGSPNDVTVRALVRSAAIAGGGVNAPGRTDRHRLARTPIVRADGIDAFARKARGELRLEGWARERLDGLRYRSSER